MFEAVSQRFGNDFVADITKTDWAKISGSDRSSVLRNESNESAIDGSRKMSRLIERSD